VLYFEFREQHLSTAQLLLARVCVIDKTLDSRCVFLSKHNVTWKPDLHIATFAFELSNWDIGSHRQILIDILPHFCHFLATFGNGWMD